jgi:hypothetical protein
MPFQTALTQLGTPALEFAVDARTARLSAALRAAAAASNPPLTAVYGVYIVRVSERTGDVLYIGKGGTVRQNGTLLEQDVFGRLPNIHDGRRGDEWARDLAVHAEAPLHITIFDTWSAATRNGRRLAPAFAEATLLQAFLEKYGSLPLANKSL